jgi:hypothetical protein
MPVQFTSSALRVSVGGRCNVSYPARCNTIRCVSCEPVPSRARLLQWAGSCWYYLRYIDPGNAGALVDPEAEKYWMPVDLYVGGAEHAVLHLLYARFWHKVRQ